MAPMHHVGSEFDSNDSGEPFPPIEVCMGMYVKSLEHGGKPFPSICDWVKVCWNTISVMNEHWKKYDGKETC